MVGLEDRAHDWPIAGTHLGKLLRGQSGVPGSKELVTRHGEKSLNRLFEVMETEEAEQGRDLRAMNHLVLGVDITKERHRCVVLRRVNTLHGGEFDRLVHDHSPRRGIGTDRLKNCGEGGKAGGDRHRSLGEVPETPLEQVPGADAHHEESTGQPGGEHHMTDAA